jgi:ribonuclease P protein component
MTNGEAKELKAKNPISMIRLQKDIDELFAMRKSLVRSGNQTSSLSSIYHLREIEENDEPLLLLFHAPKKFIKQAHERNKLKRWIREAIRKSEEIQNAVKILRDKKLQVLLLVRADFKPSKDHAWNEIKNDIVVIGNKLGEKIQNSKFKTQNS